jgi:catechol 2,3-dioxygenase-like lactoylglutathione lyase family enzyme
MRRIRASLPAMSLNTDLPRPLGLRHLALWVPSGLFDATARFYREGMGMAVDWAPDADNVYLSSGADNLALHRARADQEIDLSRSPLDHLGFCMPSAAAVRGWFERLSAAAEALEITITAEVKVHRDGATSFYLRDPAGHSVQVIHIPSVSA